MKLAFIRHAETAWNATGRWQGHADTPLNATGNEQAARLARRLAHWPLDVVLSSDLQRAAETARPVARQNGAPLVLRPVWRERDVGLCSGLTTPEIKARWPEETKRYGFDPPEGETMLDFRRRITHGGVIHTLLGHVWGYDPYDSVPLTGRVNTSITTLLVNGDVIRPGTINDHAHLEPLFD